MTGLRYMIVDDDLLDQLSLLSLLGLHPFLQHMATCNNAADAYTAIHTLQPQVVFFDIDMPGGNGIDLLKTVKDIVPVSVFVTSHMEYALESYELQVLDFLLKPVTEERVAKTAARIQDFWQLKEKAEAWSVFFEQENITIKDGYNQLRIPVSDIVYVEAMKDYTKLVTPTKSYLTLSPFTQFIERLPAKLFMRVHRSYAVAIHKIKELRNNEIICGNQSIIPIGKTYRPLMSQLKL